MVGRILIALCLLATVAQGQVARKVIRPDLGSITNGNGMVGWWPLDDVGASTPDQSGSGNSGTISGVSAAAAGRIGSSLLFNGTSTAVNAGSNAVLLVTGNFAITAWVKKRVGAHGNAILTIANRGIGGVLGYSFTIGGAYRNYKLYYTKLGTAEYPSPTITLTDTEWHFVAISLSGTTMTYTKDGFSETATVAAPASSTYPFEIGVQVVSFNYFDGRIDDVRVFNRSLSAAEVKAMYYARRTTQ
jgi:hypothetical protein